MAGIQIDGVNNKIDFDDDADTSISSATDDTLVIESGGANIASITAGEFAINEGSADIDFRVECNDGTHALFVDAGNNVVIVGGIDGSGTTPVPTNTNGGTDPVFQLQGANNANQHTFHISASIDAQNNPGAIIFSKSRDNTLNGNTILQNGDRIGEIIFCAADGTDRNPIAAKICSDVDGSPGSNDMPGRLEFHTTADGADSSTEKMRIHSHGQVLIGDTLSAEDSQKLHVSRNDKSCAFGAEIRHGSLDGSVSVAEISCVTASSSAYRLLRGVSGNGSSSAFSDNEFIFTGAGGLSIDGGSVTTGGADYAEMFEWKDGNSSSEDRRGYSVVLDGNKVVKATDSDDASKIIGVVSALPVVIGDSDIDDKWKSKYLKDDFGNYILEEYTSTEWTETYKNLDGEDQIKQHSYATDRIPSDVTVPSDATVRVVDVDGNKFTRKKLNPEWDSTQTYVRRQDRKEWDAIGLMGKLRMLKGQPTGTNWIKMRDISDTVEEWLVR